VKQSITNDTSEMLQWRYLYDLNGSRIAIINPASRRIDYQYDPWCRLKEIKLPGASETKRTRIVFSIGVRDQVEGMNITGMIPPGQTVQTLVETTIEFDERRRPFRRKLAGLRLAGLNTVTWWDRDNRIIAQVDPRDHATRSKYDGLGRLIRLVDPLGNMVINKFDPAGNLEIIEEHEIVTGLSTPQIFSTQLRYDARNRLKTLKDPLGNMLSVEYDSRDLPVILIDPLKNEIEQKFDLDGNLIGMRTFVGSPHNLLNSIG